MTNPNEDFMKHVERIVTQLEADHPETFSHDYYNDVMTLDDGDEEFLTDEDRRDLSLPYEQWLRQKRELYTSIASSLATEDSDNTYRRRSKSYNRQFPKFGEQVKDLREKHQKNIVMTTSDVKECVMLEDLPA